MADSRAGVAGGMGGQTKCLMNGQAWWCAVCSLKPAPQVSDRPRVWNENWEVEL